MVYDSSGIRGLTARAAQQFNAAGYDVRFTDDIRDSITATTAYFDPPQRAIADALVAAHLGVVRAVPRPRFLLPTGTVIVVLASDYARR
ncbi:MAG TPA: LytR C-terminal domain-containing protein [Mycobacteriales bacterium]|nr:LytR C-terminal domain-containing protein [Mycobacteriales bacterium]